jgi:hypothetical protein
LPSSPTAVCGSKANDENISKKLQTIFMAFATI